MGSSDLQVIFPVFLFVMFTVVLSSFFVINSDTSLGLKTPDKFDIPFHPMFNGTKYNEDGTIIEEEGYDFIGVASAIGLVIGGGALIFLSAGLATPLVVAGGFVGIGAIGTGVLRYVSTLTGGEEFIASIPVVGAIYSGLNYVATAIVSFGQMATFSIGALGGSPLILVCIATPIIFMFFVFIIRFIRGQG